MALLENNHLNFNSPKCCGCKSDETGSEEHPLFNGSSDTLASARLVRAAAREE
jgi:hypothetical protein